MSPAPEIEHPWRVRLFGSIRVEGRQPVAEFPTRRAKLLLLRLALTPGERIDREELCQLLWPDEFTDASRPRLRQELARLKTALGPAAEILDGDRRHLWLNARTDLAEWQKATAEESSRLYGFGFAPGHQEPWIADVRETIQNRQIENLIALADLRSQNGDHAAALAFAQSAAQIQPLSEEAHFRILSALIAANRPIEAQLHLNAFSTELIAAVGIGPSDRLRQLLTSTPTLPKSAELTASPPRAALNPLLGRTEPLAKILEWLLRRRPNSSRLLTIGGPGGIGKTRLAQELHRLAYPELENRVWFIDLTDVFEPARIAPTILQQLGLTLTEVDPLDTVAAHLSDTPALFILDNFEQLVDGGAHIVKRLLGENPGLLIVATSRRRLNVPSETELPLGPLSSIGENSPAVDLFLRGAHSARGDIDTGETAQSLIREIVDLLDGNPLAINLAAGRATVFSISELRQLLPHRLDLLSSRDPDVDPRHRQLRSAVQWSYDLLPPHLQNFLLDLTAFRHGWQIEDAEALLEEPAAADYLQDLVEHSFIQTEETEDGMRFRMLVTIRSFLENLISPDHREALSARHARSFAALSVRLAPQMRSANGLPAYRRIEFLREEFYAAIRWSIKNEPETAVAILAELWRFWNVRGQQWEALQWARFVLTVSEPITLELSVALFGIAHCASEASEFDLAIELYERNRVVAQQRADAPMIRMNEISYAGTLSRRGEYESAISSLEHWLPVFLENRAFEDGALCRDELGMAYLGVGRFEEAAQQFHLAASVIANFADRIPYAHLSTNRGYLALATGDLDLAKTYFQEANETFRTFGTWVGIGYASHGLAQIALAKNDDAEAERLIAVSDSACDMIRDKLGLARVALVRAEIAERRGLGDEAEAHWIAARRLLERVGHRSMLDALDRRYFGFQTTG